MNIAYILHTTSPTDGATKAILALMPKLCKNGITPYFIVPDKNGIYESLKTYYRNVFATTFRPSCYPYHRNFKEKILFLPRLVARRITEHIGIARTYSYLKDKNISIVHTNVSIINLGYYVAKHLAIPHVFHIREYAEEIGYQRYPSRNAFIKKLCQNNSYNITITKAIQQYYEQEKNKNSSTIYDGIPMSGTEIANVTKENFFLFAGRIQKAKGLDLIIDAFHNAKCNKSIVFPLYIAGASIDNVYLQMLKQKITKYHLEDLIIFKGERKDLAQMMQKATAIIIATEYEGFGLCMVEAMQNNCLVIGRNTAGTREQFDNGLALKGQEIGLRYRNSMELSNIISKISNKKTNYADTVKKAKEAINELYTIGNSSNKLIQLYDNIINKE